jgi:NAD(P)-dependent dehydrogenase (short-subunit alcohol dehydrogenase family)
VADKVIVVTGANGGLGMSVTQVLLDAGNIVAGVSPHIRPDNFKSPNFFPIAASLSTREDSNAAIQQVIARFGRIDALVHLVGGFAGGKPLVETEDGVFEKMSDLNLRSAFLAIRSTLPQMVTAKSGCIIAIGSRAAVEPSPGAALYAAFKAALVSLIRSIAAENKDAGVTANIILPGTMDTPANRAADPTADFSKWIDTRRVAELVAFLVSDAASQINGAVIPVYGSDV